LPSLPFSLPPSLTPFPQTPKRTRSSKDAPPPLLSTPTKKINPIQCTPKPSATERAASPDIMSVCSTGDEPITLALLDSQVVAQKLKAQRLATTLGNVELNVAALKEHKDAQDTLIAEQMELIKKLRFEMDHVNTFLEAKYPSIEGDGEGTEEEESPVPSRATKSPRTAQPPRTTPPREGGRKITDYKTANDSQRALPLIPAKNLTKLSGATLREGWEDGSKSPPRDSFTHKTHLTTTRTRLSPHPPRDAAHPPPKALAYDGEDISCTVCRKKLIHFWVAQKGTTWVSCYKKNAGDAIEGCVTMLSEARYDYVMSNIEAIMEESASS